MSIPTETEYCTVALQAQLDENAYRGALQLVAQMRKAQKAYFKSRKQTDLIESKRLETAVDMKLGELEIKAV